MNRFMSGTCVFYIAAYCINRSSTLSASLTSPCLCVSANEVPGAPHSAEETVPAPDHTGQGTPGTAQTAHSARGQSLAGITRDARSSIWPHLRLPWFFPQSPLRPALRRLPLVLPFIVVCHILLWNLCSNLPCLCWRWPNVCSSFVFRSPTSVLSLSLPDILVGRY